MSNSRHAATFEAGGEGALLGAAAGDMLVSGTRGAYGSAVQQMVFTAYQFLRSLPIERYTTAANLLEYAAPEDGRMNVFRTPGAWLNVFIEEAKLAPPTPLPFVNAGAAIRAVPVGVWFRKDPAALVDGTIETIQATHSRPESSVVGCMIAGAVAAAGYGQSGRDLVNGAIEIGRQSETRVGTSTGVPDVLERTRALVELGAKDVSAEVMSWELDDPEVEAAAITIAIAARPFDEASIVVRDAAGIVGAHSGLHRWPWPVPNDLWFAEVGRRLARQHAYVDDLPDPYAVEEVLNYELATDTIVER